MSVTQNSLPFIPFTRPHFNQETIDAVAEVLRSGWVTSGPKLAEFEATLSEYFGGRPVRCFANGTATMKIALQVLFAIYIVAASVMKNLTLLRTAHFQQQITWLADNLVDKI